MVGRERQTHLDMAGMDRYVCEFVCSSVYSMCMSGWGYRSGWGLVQSHPRLDLAKAQINTNMKASFLHRIANTHFRCGSEAEPLYTADSVLAAM